MAEFRHFKNEDYEAVCEFLIELNRNSKDHINWNWARFEWMYEHPEFDKSSIGFIGLWTDSDRVVGAAIYDMYFGEAFCGVLPGYEELYPEILDYAYENLSDDAGLGIAICDDSPDEIRIAEEHGFAAAEQTETIMEKLLDKELAADIPEELTIIEPDPVKDEEALKWLFWQGFDHGDDRAEFEKEDQPSRDVRKHLDPHLGLAAADESGEMVSFCCLWYIPGTDYAYVEPVCTIPKWRRKGVAKALLSESMNRARELGAKRAYVISDQEFYERLGFRKTKHFTFYWK
ncbi:MAG: GNAT family N-acetyltransferase [Oscillospiraceae bacterium]|nr:GNAT family N-acetyltransferase [Oscillospiraceae bacterium]